MKKTIQDLVLEFLKANEDYQGLNGPECEVGGCSLEDIDNGECGCMQDTCYFVKKQKSRDI